MIDIYADEESINILGLMSGTSGDGIDGALVSFKSNGEFALLWHQYYPFSPETKLRLRNLMRKCSADEAALAAAYVGKLYAKAVRTFFKRQKEPIDLLAAHGQTIAHHPLPLQWDEIKVTGTMQVINAAILSEELDIPVVSDFRIRDMAVGGQGAPLVPFGDLIFFGKALDSDFGVLNVGGIANVTIIRRRVKPLVTQAFDTGPGNMLMDDLARIISNGKSEFDEDGKTAAVGKTNQALLHSLMQDPFIAAPPPKSSGRDRFGTTRLESIREKLSSRISNTDLMSTLLDFTVDSIALSMEKFVFPEGKISSLIIAGGGALNKEFCRRLCRKLASQCEIVKSDKFGVPISAREAMAFAALGYAFVKGIPSNIPAASGASKEVTLGVFTPASSRKFRCLQPDMKFPEQL